MDIRPFLEEDRRQVLRLWKTVFADDPPHNDPQAVIDAKLKVDELLFVAVEEGTLIGTVMAGYDGHRGWLYSVAVDPQQRRARFQFNPIYPLQLRPVASSVERH